MKKWLRRIRGAIGMGLTWAAAWSGASMIMMLGVLLITGTRPDVPVPLVFGVFGFVGGVTFSGVLSLLEGPRAGEPQICRFLTFATQVPLSEHAQPTGTKR